MLYRVWRRGWHAQPLSMAAWHTLWLHHGVDCRAFNEVGRKHACIGSPGEVGVCRCVCVLNIFKSFPPRGIPHSAMSCWFSQVKGTFRARLSLSHTHTIYLILHILNQIEKIYLYISVIWICIMQLYRKSLFSCIVSTTAASKIKAIYIYIYLCIYVYILYFLQCGINKQKKDRKSVV